MEGKDLKVTTLPKAVERLASADEISRVAEQNAKVAQQMRIRGEELLSQKSAMTEGDFEEKGRDYVEACDSTVKQLKSNRQSITRSLTDTSKVFTSIENSLLPDKEDTPAWEVNEFRRHWLQKRYEELLSQEKSVMTAAERNRIKITDDENLTDGEKHDKLVEYDLSVTKSLADIRMEMPRTRKAFRIIDRSAYRAIFTLWWSNIGLAMEPEELEKAMHPMLAYARKKAADRYRLVCNGIEYYDEVIL